MHGYITPTHISYVSMFYTINRLYIPKRHYSAGIYNDVTMCLLRGKRILLNINIYNFHLHTVHLDNDIFFIN